MKHSPDTFKPNTPLLLAALAAALALPALPALGAGFTGAYAPGQWASANVGTLTGAAPTGGSTAFTATTLTLTGSDTTSSDPSNFAPGCAGGGYGVLASPCQVQTTLAKAGSYSFDWAYLTADDSGPGADLFGVIVDGTRIQLSDPGGAVAQSGSATFAALSSFGFFVNCTDCIGGGASATLTNFAAAVPEPATLALWLAGGAALLSMRKVRRDGAARSADARVSL